MSEGPQGPTGPTGPQGLTGPVGPQGPRGIQGVIGAQGIQGVQGLASTVGAQGRTGPVSTIIVNTISGYVLTSSGTTTSVVGQSNLQSTSGTLTVLGNTNVNGVLRASSGIAVEPAYSFPTDTTSGMFSPVSNNLAFSVAGTAHIRILSNGNVGIGLTNPTFQLQLSTNSAAKPTSSAWTISSDERIKRNIVDADIQTCYDTVKSLKLKRFEWDPSWNATLPDRHSLGFIAQEVKQYFPKSVTIIETEEYPDFHTLDVDQLYKAMYGALVKLVRDKEDLERRIQIIKKNRQV